MNIMVFDVPAEHGGALSILNDFYHEVIDSNEKNINWFFVLSTPTFKETENISILRFPWIKKSWLHRFYFDKFIAPKLVKECGIDKIFSLQNVTISRVSCDQILYVHQPLPFVDYKFTFKENKLFWTYQNIIGRKITNSIKKAQCTIVQTHWMKKSCIERAQIQSHKIEVIPPTINLKIEKYFEPDQKSLATFFFPAGGSSYKNHKVIVDACLLLKRVSKLDYQIFFTLNGNESLEITNLYRQIQEEQLPIHFLGSKTRKEVFELYTKSILLFPSYIETFGMPMLEAKMHKGVIIASDCQFSHEILDGYENAYFFDPFNASTLSSLLERFIMNEIRYEKVKEDRKEYNRNILNQILKNANK